MVDLLGRTGNLEQVKHFIQEMPLNQTARIWGSLLVAARNNTDIAEFAAKKIFSLEHGCYVLLSNMYAEAGSWEDMEWIKSLVGSCRFSNHDQSSTKTAIIYDMLDIILGKCVHDITKYRLLDLASERRISSRSHSIKLYTDLTYTKRTGDAMRYS
ncbi:LOW QUALITY PROTEIN: E motif [Dillenia turbinata]|uniref:E motif n=1 Tax=Dillenia turbinata TaxID=194707 RepID=A0AAN8UMB9_9MAGN